MARQRLQTYEVEPESLKAILAMEKFVRKSSLDQKLRELVKIRASQINGCAWCLDMHTRDAVNDGEDPRRIFVVSAWREAPDLYTERERAALEMTEYVTRIGEDGVPDDVWQRAKAVFDDNEMAQLLMAVCVINVWNRIAVATHADLPDVPGESA